MITNAIRLESVSKRFGNKQALDQVTLEVPLGCVFALLGENGAGKTTAIRTILGLQKPDSGRIEVLGCNPRRYGARLRRQIGYVPDSPALYEWMTVAEIGWFTAGFYTREFRANFEKLCQQFQLPLDPKIKQLSKGGKAKVGLALALAHQPQLLILDEPTSGLDTLVRRNFLESMVDVAVEGRTVLLSSHQIPEVERVADYVAIINGGRVLVCQRLEDLKQDLERWVLTLETEHFDVSGVEATILTHEGQGRRRQQLVIRDASPEALWQLRDRTGVTDVEVHTPSLEEIFVAYMKADASVTQPVFHRGPSKRPVKGRGRFGV